MLKNFWYACDFSSEITKKPKQIAMLKQRFVLYRDSQGQIVALEDQCPHRGAALSLGWVEDSCIRCPYHGWKFQADGKCVDIPANPSETSIPKRAHIAAYPVQEKYGFVWFFYGDLPEAERPPIPTLPAEIFTDLHPVCHSALEPANYERLMEANIDFAHAIAIHRKSFGQRIPLKQTIRYQVEKSDWSAIASYTYDSLNSSKSILNVLLGGRPTLSIRLSYYLPNLTLAELNIGGDSRFPIKFNILVSFLPIDEKTTTAKRVLYRNILKYPWLDNFMTKLDYKLAHEDTIVVETLTDQLMPRISGEVHVAADALSLAYRKHRQKYLGMGWGLDSAQNKSDSANGHLEPIFSVPLVK